MENDSVKMENVSAPGPAWSHILMPLFVLVVILIGYGFLAKNFNWWPHEIATSPTPSTSDVATTGWQTYRNSDYGFEISYPSNLSLTDDSRPGLSLNMEISGRTNVGIWVDATQNDYLCSRQSSGASRSIKVMIAGVEMEKVTCGNPAYREWYFYENGTHAYTLVIGYSSGDGDLVEPAPETLATDAERKAVEKILATFRFTEATASVDTTGWKTYKAVGLDFEIKYPSSWTLGPDPAGTHSGGILLMAPNKQYVEVTILGGSQLNQQNARRVVFHNGNTFVLYTDSPKDPTVATILSTFKYTK